MWPKYGIKKHSQAVEIIKETTVSVDTLTHYDPNLHTNNNLES